MVLVFSPGKFENNVPIYTPLYEKQIMYNALSSLENPNSESFLINAIYNSKLHNGNRDLCDLRSLQGIGNAVNNPYKLVVVRGNIHGQNLFYGSGSMLDKNYNPVIARDFYVQVQFMERSPSGELVETLNGQRLRAKTTSGKKHVLIYPPVQVMTETSLPAKYIIQSTNCANTFDRYVPFQNAGDVYFNRGLRRQSTYKTDNQIRERLLELGMDNKRVPLKVIDPNTGLQVNLLEKPLAPSQLLRSLSEGADNCRI